MIIINLQMKTDCKLLAAKSESWANVKQRTVKDLCLFIIVQHGNGL